MRFVVLIIVGVTHFTLTAKVKDSLKKHDIVVLPVIYYQPETNIAFETFAMYHFKFKNARHSNIRLFNVYTLNKQLLSILPWQIFTNNEKFLFSGRIEYKVFPEYFYGIGNQTCETSRENYTYKSFNFNPKLLKKTSENIFIGGDFQFVKNKNELSNNTVLFNSNSILGKNQYHLFSLGFNVIKDTRDFVLNPQKGKYLEFKQSFSRGIADNQRFEFCKILFDYRDYKSLTPKIVFAQQLYAQIGIGNIPFREMSTIGGPNVLRGYYQGRFRDESVIFYQSEWRQMIYKKWGYALNIGYGKVFNQFDFFDQKSYNCSFGGGLRYILNKNNRSSIRLDYGLTPDSQGLYVYFSEAF